MVMPIMIEISCRDAADQQRDARAMEDLGGDVAAGMRRCRAGSGGLLNSARCSGRPASAERVARVEEVGKARGHDEDEDEQHEAEHDGRRACRK